MIIIDKPFIQTLDDKVYYQAHITDEKAGYANDCYYVAEKEFGKYFSDEVADAFVIGLLLPALQSNQDIIVKAAMSEKLYYSLSNTAIFAYSKAFGYQENKIIPEQLINPKIDSFGVGTGCSLGIDSFSTILHHTSISCEESYKLSHLTFFNVGSLGEKNVDKVKESYQKELENVKKFAAEINLPLISLESNLAVFFSHYDYNFNQTHVIRGMSMVLSMQKLFKKYIYSSGYPISEIHLSGIDPTYMEAMLLPALSTENTELIVGGPNQSRTDKARIISDNEMVQKYLYVCVKDLVVNNDMHYGPWVNIDEGHTRNCSGCDKCLRTMVTLDALGKLEKYSELFDIPKYHKLRKLFMAKIIGLRNKSFVFKDMFNLVHKESYKISMISRILSLIYQFGLNDLYYRFAGAGKNKK
ncbi:MAG: hypothetical protein KKA07_12875 [Bacteroidetes bacterium]|nr:hypothetical protein [Bacteroidota bacterium]MBU1719951.1 hypothetical protein [Bacteroidota bacterium]